MLPVKINENLIEDLILFKIQKTNQYDNGKWEIFVSVRYLLMLLTFIQFQYMDFDDLNRNQKGL